MRVYKVVKNNIGGEKMKRKLNWLFQSLILLGEFHIHWDFLILEKFFLIDIIIGCEKKQDKEDALLP